MLTTVAVPEGVDEAAVRRRLLGDYGIEIAGGLGEFRGKAWRIGLMGHSARGRNVTLVLAALGEALRRQGRRVPVEAALEAAADMLSAAPENIV